MNQATTSPTISCRELYTLVQEGQTVDLIDVRTPMEFHEVHSQIARNISLDELDPEKIMAERATSAEEPVYVICRSGSRGAKAAAAFHAAGFNNVVNVEGGTLAWDEAGYPVKRGTVIISLERQVRIAAGLMVLLGVGLSFVNPWLIGISAFVGAGLVFAGITNTCGMGLMLAKMPWNRVTESCSR